MGKCLEVWDIQKQELDVRIGKYSDVGRPGPFPPIFWTNKNKKILAAFTFTDDYATTIYEFNASTLETVGTPFKGHTKLISGLALSSDCTLLASSSDDHSIKLWAIESRQLLASFNVEDTLITLVLSPDSRKLVYTSYTEDDDNDIYICDTPPDVLATMARETSTPDDLLNSDATRRPPTMRRRPPIPVIPMAQRPPPIINPQQPILLRLRKLLPFSSRTNITPVRNNFWPRGPLDFPATSPLPHHLSGRTTTQGRSDINSSENSRWWPVRAGNVLPPIVNVPLAPGQLRNAVAGAPRADDEYIRDEGDVPPSLNTGTHGSDRCCFCF